MKARQNGGHLADDIFAQIFFNENYDILIKISLKSILKGFIANKSVLVQVMTWYSIGDKPLFEPMETQFRLCINESLKPQGVIFHSPGNGADILKIWSANTYLWL